MSEMFQSIINIPPPFNMIVLIVLFGSLASVLGTIAWQISAVAIHRQELTFKRELVERGMTAEEIERIVRAKSPEHVEAEVKT